MIREETSRKVRINRRQALKIVGGAALAAGLSACGGGQAPPATQAPAGEAKPTEAPKAEAVTITLWRSDLVWFSNADEFKTFYDKTMPEVLPKNITVNHVEVPEALFDKIQASIAAGNPPDVSWVDQTWVAPLLALEAIQPMPDDLLDVKATFGSFANDFFRVGKDKKVYILPIGWWERGVFYNIKLLKERGYEPKDLPKKVADLIPFAKELTTWEEGKAEPSIAAWPLAGGTTFDFYTAIVDNLGGFWWLDDTTSGFGEPEWEEAWSFTLDMFDKFKVDARAGLDAIDRFYSGKALFLPQQLWVGNVLRKEHKDIEWGVMTHPTPSGGPPYGWKEAHTGWSVLSSGKGAQLDAAWQVWKAVYSPEWTTIQAKGCNYLPGRLEALDKAPFTADNLEWAGAVEKHKAGNSVCPGFWPDDLWKTSNEAWEKVYKSNGNVHDTLQEAKQAADVVLANSPATQETILTKKDYEEHSDWTEGKIPVKAWWDRQTRSYLNPDQR